MERDEGQPNDNPNIPDDISELVDDTQAREQQRQRAINEMLARADTAISPEEAEMWLEKAAEMEEIRDDFRHHYPEIFPDEDGR